MSTSLGGATGSKIPKGFRTGRIAQYEPEQMSLLKSLYPYVNPGSQLSKLAQGSEEGFAPYEEYARRQFQSAQGQLGSRFAGLSGTNAMSATRGSAFKNAANQASQDFALTLAGQRQGLQRQALLDLMGLSHQLLGERPYENFLVKKPLPFGQQFALNLAQGLGSAGGGLLGGGIGLFKGLFGGGQQQQQQSPQWQQTSY